MVLMARVFGCGSSGKRFISGNAGTSILGRTADKNDSNDLEASTLSLKKGLSSPQNRAMTVFSIEQKSRTISGPLPGVTHGDTTKVGTLTP